MTRREYLDQVIIDYQLDVEYIEEILAAHLYSVNERLALLRLKLVLVRTIDKLMEIEL